MTAHSSFPFEVGQVVVYVRTGRDRRFARLPEPAPQEGGQYRIVELVANGYLRLEGFEHLSRHMLHWIDFEPLSGAFDTTTPYSSEELLAAHDGRWPFRGDKCDECGGIVPQFAELKAEDRARILQLISERNFMLAHRELRRCTAAPGRFMKIWVSHAGAAQSRFSGPPCPHCGQPLNSQNAKQCLHCHVSWHKAAQPAVDVDGP